MTAIQPLYTLVNPMPHASRDAPIGIFDSGIGGLSVAQEIARHLPMNRYYIMLILLMFPMARGVIKISVS